MDQTQIWKKGAGDYSIWEQLDFIALSRIICANSEYRDLAFSKAISSNKTNC